MPSVQPVVMSGRAVVELGQISTLSTQMFTWLAAVCFLYATFTQAILNFYTFLSAVIVVGFKKLLPSLSPLSTGLIISVTK